MVLGRRHRDPRPGTHEPIITEDELRDATTGIETRKRGRARPRHPRRFYLLSGLLHCSCGARMRGDARVARGRVYRCLERRLDADEAERLVLEAASRAVLPAAAITAAREELRRRLKAPASGSADRRRASLPARLGKLRDLYEWGDLDEGQYRSKREALERELLALLIERVVAGGRQVREILWTPAAHPFFGADRTLVKDGVVVLARPEGLEPPTL